MGGRWGGVESGSTVGRRTSRMKSGLEWIALSVNIEEEALVSVFRAMVEGEAGVWTPTKSNLDRGKIFSLLAREENFL